MIYGYFRTLFSSSDVEKHMQALKSFGCQVLYHDKYIRNKPSQEQRSILLSKVQSGDIVIVPSFGHIASSPQQLFDLVQYFTIYGIGLRTLTYTLPQGPDINSFLEEFVIFQKELVQQKTLAGFARAKAEGKPLGKPQGLSEISKLKAKRAYELRLQGLSATKIQSALSIKSKQTLYSYLRFEAARLKKLNPFLELAENKFDFVNLVDSQQIQK